MGANRWLALRELPKRRLTELAAPSVWQHDAIGRHNTLSWLVAVWVSADSTRIPPVAYVAHSEFLALQPGSAEWESPHRPQIGWPL